MAIPPTRRNLAFASLADIPADVERLLLAHATVGRWSLAQILNHLSASLNYTLDGIPGRPLPRLLQLTLGRRALARVLRNGTLPRRFPIPWRLQPPPGLNPRTEATNLYAALTRLRDHRGSFADHPIFGPMTPDQWLRYHCIHCAHHLSFAVPLSPRPLDANSPIDTTTTP